MFSLFFLVLLKTFLKRFAFFHLSIVTVSCGIPSISTRQLQLSSYLSLSLSLSPSSLSLISVYGFVAFVLALPSVFVIVFIIVFVFFAPSVNQNVFDTQSALRLFMSVYKNLIASYRIAMRRRLMV